MARTPVTGRPKPRRWRLVRVGRVAVPASLRRLTTRARAGRWRGFFPWLVAAGVALCVGVGMWIWYGTSLFAVDQIKVTGTHVLDPAQVRSATGVATGTPLSRVDPDAVADRVAALAPVDDVVVDRDWPGTLVVTVTERTPVAVVSIDGGFGVLSADGVVFQEVPERPAELPLVRVTDPGPDDVTTRDALHVLQALTDPLLEQLVAVVAESPTRISLELTEGRTVVWGDATRSDRKAEVATALLREPGTVYDVSAPDVVTTR